MNNPANFSLFILYYCVNFACKDIYMGEGEFTDTHAIQVHNHGLLIRWLLKVSIELISLM